MKRSVIKTGAAVLCTALAITLYGNVYDALAFEVDVPYEEFGIDPSTLPDAYKFYDYLDFAVVVVLPMETGCYPTDELNSLAREAENAVCSITYDRSMTFEENVARLGDVMDYYLDLMDQARLRNTYFTSYDQEKEFLIGELYSRCTGRCNPAVELEFRKAARALEALTYDDSLSLDENRLIMYRTMRNLASFEG